MSDGEVKPSFDYSWLLDDLSDASDGLDEAERRLFLMVRAAFSAGFSTNEVIAAVGDQRYERLIEDYRRGGKK